MYAIHHRRFFYSTRPEDYVVIAKNIRSIDEAKDRRWASGDLVVEQATGIIIPYHDWLWDWEKADPNCYAQKAIRHIWG